MYRQLLPFEGLQRRHLHCMNNGVCVCIDGERFNVTPLGTEEFFKTEIMKRLGK